MKIPEDIWFYTLFLVLPAVYFVRRHYSRSPEERGMRRTVNPKWNIDRFMLRKGPEEPYSNDRKNQPPLSGMTFSAQKALTTT